MRRKFQPITNYSAGVNGSRSHGLFHQDILIFLRAIASNSLNHQPPRNPMTTATIDDSRIETRFVWARCAAQNARAMRDLIRAFQSDGWAAPRNVVAGKRRVVRRKRRASAE
jgi:hypothetical protein